MITTLIVLIVIVAILLVLVVLGQNSKGGTFASNFSASNQLIGVKKTGDLLEKLTWAFSIALMVLCILVNVLIETPDFDTQMSTPATRSIQQQQQGPAFAPEAEEGQPATEPAPDADVDNQGADPLQ